MHLMLPRCWQSSSATELGVDTKGVKIVSERKEVEKSMRGISECIICSLNGSLYFLNGGT